ncbi:MAG: hypothetical protein EXR07_06200 [Acetobacteraceae bacterium]|nr:hypothetical protein [Acetobacteraceae bacterium]
MFTRDALLLIGHGSNSVPNAARPLLAHAGIIRASGRFAEVAVGTLFGEPNVLAAFDELTSAMIHVVPFFLEDGYFTRIAIPDLLLPRISESRVLRFCPPIGSYNGIAGLLEKRLLTHCDLFGTDPKTLSVMLVGHGSAQNPGRARALRRHAATLETKHRFGWVRATYLEEEPFATTTLAASRGHVAAVLGYLVNEGAHATHDLPRLITEERIYRGTTWPPVHDLGSIGADKALPQMILDQVTATR